MLGDTFTVSTLGLAPTTIGVYAIRNLANGKCYIGSAAGRWGFRARWQEHRRDLTAGESCSTALLRAWRKYGVESFVFEVIELIERQPTAAETRVMVLSAEQRHIDAHAAARDGYNILPTAGSRLGKKLTDEQRELLRQRVASDPAWQQRLREMSVGRKRTAETREKQSAAAIARWQDPAMAARYLDGMRRSMQKRGGHSAEHRAAIAASHKGKTIPEEVRQRMSASHEGRWTDELREEQSQRIRAALADPAVKERLAAAQRGRRHSPETLEKMRAAQRLRYADPAEAARMKEAQQRGVAAAGKRGGQCE